ncbi:hypothetical protein [Pseudarthrobacter sp. H2]|uniref:hypothetical protein n=1 Tax=Pseudarthrobacter sp. H2 TaxID=3418415 RepID=UPI003CF828F9
MTDQRKTDYDSLADRLTGDSPLGVAAVQFGSDAAASGRAFLLREYGGDAAIRQAIRRGRPRVGDSTPGESATVRGRIADVEYRAFMELVTELGKPQSELIREAVHLLLEHHKKLAS